MKQTLRSATAPIIFWRHHHRAAIANRSFGAASSKRRVEDLSVVQYPAASSRKQQAKGAVTFVWRKSGGENNSNHRTSASAGVKKSWQRQAPPPQVSQTTTTTTTDLFHDAVIRHFLPANYPESVDAGYAKYCAASFVASVAGTASMVLSTQTLLLGIGVVGYTTTTSTASSSDTAATEASIMAGALNWVLKDGVGQLGGILFASRMGETRTFDANPKQWRMLSAVALDGAAMLELAVPWLAIVASSTSSFNYVLPAACAANVLKNIGFLTSAASRAAIHQSLLQKQQQGGNLADVTAKAASQSMAAGLVGTALGIGLSTTILNHDAGNFLAGFTVLAAIHQSCNYVALSHVTIRHFNRQRLYLVLQRWCRDGTILTPAQVAVKEHFLPLPAFIDGKDCRSWLSIGSSLETIAPAGSDELLQLIEPQEKFAVKAVDTTTTASNDNTTVVHLVFLETAVAEDLVRGMLHAVSLREQRRVPSQEISEVLIGQLHAAGWHTETTNIEPAGAVRLAISPTY